MKCGVREKEGRYSPNGSNNQGVGQAETENPELLWGLLCGCKDMMTWVIILHCIPWCVSRKLDHKWKGQPSNKQSYGIPTSQIEA